jgi:hypothetical protein
MISLNFPRIPPGLRKNTVIIVVGLIIILFTSFFAYSRHPIPPPSIPPLLPNATPAASSSALITLEVTGYSPRNLNPPIADTQTAVYFEFNRPLTDSEIASLQLTSKPAVEFKKIVHINRQILYFTPVNYWKNQTLYTLILSSPQSPDIKTFYFNPSSHIDQDYVQTAPEQNLPKP